MTSSESILTKDDYQALVQISTELASRIDLDDLLQVILAKSGQLSDSPDGAVLIYNTERNTLFFAGAVGGDSEMLLTKFGEFAEQQVPIEGSKAGIVFSTGNSIIIDSIAADPEHYKGVDEETRRETQSMLCVPLIAAGEKLGSMQLLNKRSGNYTERDKLLLEQFASYAAIAIRNARLFEGLIAHMGLYSSRQFRNSTSELLLELKRPACIEKLTVLFADMRGFRVLCQVINNPERILEMSSQFITMLSEQVLQHGGLVNKFLGDGILALFRNDDHAHRAVKCAFSMRKGFSSLRSIWDQEGIEQLDFLEIGIGITTDRVIIGTIGNAKVRDFTAIGTAVNLAAAFEHEARGGKHILVDNLTYLAVKDIVLESEGPVDYELRQPDQRKGNIYKQYHLKRLTIPTSHSVFISHSQMDQEFIETELLSFFNENGIRHWYSKNDIKGGESWVRKISDGLESCNWVIVVVSESSVKSEWVKQEIEMAAALPHLINKILPLRIDKTRIEDVNPFLRHKQIIDAAKHNYLSELLSVIKGSEENKPV